MQVTFWGVRGSHPVSGSRFAEFGHHSSCVQVSAGEAHLVLDCGTGAAALGEVWRRQPPGRVEIVLSHLHHDHIAGLPFLLLALGQNARVSIHAALGRDFALGDALERVFSPPFFPLSPSAMCPNLNYVSHDANAHVMMGGLEVSTVPQDHPGGSSMIRLDAGGKRLVYATDLEAGAIPDPAQIALAQGADLLIHDTMIASADIDLARGWGHSTIEGAVDLARAAGVTRLVGFHHSASDDDARLTMREDQLQSLWPKAVMAREGMQIDLQKPT